MGKVVDALVDGTPLGKLVWDAVGVDAWWEIGVGKYIREALIPVPDTSFNNDALGQQQMVRSPIEARRSIYGRAMVSGPMTFVNETGNDNEYLHFILPLAAHRCASVEEIYFNDELVYSNGQLDDKYKNHARINIHLGDQTTADPNLVAECSNWTVNHVGFGITYLAVRLKHDPKFFTEGLPNVKALVKGKPIYDPRLDSSIGGAGSHRINDVTTWAWSDNWALCVLDYTLFESGVGALPSEVDFTTYALAANDSDQLIVYDDEGHTEKRYTCNGTFTQSMTPASVLDKLLTAGAGMQSYLSGKYQLYSGVYQGPYVLELGEDDLAGNVEIRPFNARANLCNAVRGTFIDPENFYQPTDFPPYESSYYRAQDGDEYIDHDVDLAFTQSLYTAQRLAKLYLELNRAAQQIVLPLNMIGLSLSVGKVVAVNLPRLGINGEYQVVDWDFDFGQPCKVTLRETAIPLFEYDLGSYTTRPLTPPLNLPNAKNVPTVTGLVWIALGDDANYQGTLTWNAPGGNSAYRYQIEVTDTAQTLVYQTSVEGTLHNIPKLDAGTYTISIWAVNLFSNRSNIPATLVIGANAPPTITSIQVDAGALELVLRPQTAALIAQTTVFEVVGGESNLFINALPIGQGKEVIWPSLHANTVYYVWARAINNFGAGSWFGPVAVQTTADKSALVELLGDTFKSFTWFAWADDASGSGFTTVEALGDGKAYMGIATDKPTSSPSGNWQDYTWSKIQTEIPPVFTPEEEAKLDNLMAGKLPFAPDKDMLAAQDALNNPALANNLITALSLLNQGINAPALGGETPSGAQSKASSAQSAAIAAAATDATSKANNAKAQAEANAALDALNKANTAKADAISTAATDATNKVDAVRVGGVNLFENSANITLDRTTSEHGYFASIQHVIDKLENDEPITISFDVDSVYGNYIQCYNSNWSGERIFSPYKSFQSFGPNKVRLSFTTKIQNNSGTITKPGDTWIEFYSNYGTGDFWKVSKLKIERGTKATDWSPAPEDHYDYADAAQASAIAAAAADATTKANNAKAQAEANAALDALNKANTAKADAINTASSDATTKANNAKSAAESYALTKANLAETTAKAYADGIVSDEEARAIADAQVKADAAKAAAIAAAASDATTKANNAKSQAEANAALDALNKANTAKTDAISTASTDATTKANNAKTQAISSAATDATTKADAAKAAAIAAAASDATTKANNAKAQAETNAALDALNKANTAKADAISTASTDATTKADNAKTQAVSSAAADATTKADVAKAAAIAAAAADATSKANNAKAQAEANAALDALNKANTAKSDAISAAASDAANKVDAVKVGGVNLFENSANITMDRTTSEHGYFASIQHVIDKLENDEPITISFDIDSVYGNYIHCYNSNHAGERIFSPSKVFQSFGPNKVRLSFTTKIVNKGGTIPSPGDTWIEFYSIYGTGDFWKISKLKIERGTKATDWSPAPEDHYDYSDATKESAIAAAAVDATSKSNNAKLQAIGDVSAGNFAAQTALITTLLANSGLFNQLKSRLGTFGGLTAETIAALAIATNHLQAGAVTVDKVGANAITAEKIAALAIATNHLQAGAVTVDKVGANAITAVKIAALAIATNHLQAGAVTVDKVSANAITAEKIAALAIATNHLQSGVVTADKITADTALIQKLIANVGLFNQLQAQLGVFGGLAANSIAAKAITASKLVVTGGGTINYDPMLLDADAWAASLGGISFFELSDAPAGKRVLRSNGTVKAYPYDKNYYPIDTSKTYRFRFWARSAAGTNGVLYACLKQYSSIGVPCANNGGRNPYKPAGVSVPTTWTEYSFQWGAGDWQEGVKYVVLDWLLNYGGSAGYMEICYPRLEEMASSELIVDGAITTQKILSKAITTDKIAANAVTATELLADTALINKLVATSALFDSLVARLAVFGGLTANSIASDAILGRHIKAGEKISSPIIEGGEVRLIGTAFMKVQSATAFGPDGLVEWYGPKLLVNGSPDWANLRKSNAITYLAANGDAYFGGSLSAGVLKTGVTNTDKNPYTANSYPVQIGPFSTNGKAKVIVVSFTLSCDSTQTSAPPSNPTQPNLSWQLQRKIGSGSWTTVSSGVFSGTTNNTYEAEPPAHWVTTERCSGSSTYTDNTVSTSDFSYRILVVSFSRFHATANVNTQSLSLISTEQ